MIAQMKLLQHLAAAPPTGLISFLKAITGEFGPVSKSAYNIQYESRLYIDVY